MPAKERIPACPDGLVKNLAQALSYPAGGQVLRCRAMSVEPDDQESLRARSEQAISELAQALLDSQVLENAVAAAFGAREKALEAQHAAMAALDLASASDVERMERRLRSLSQRLDDVEDQVDRVARDVGEIRRLSDRADREADSRAS
jgi:small-conductance mechanosensitive channel